MQRVDGVPQFSDSSINELDGDDDVRYWFEAPMVSTCRPLFDDLDSNYDVEARLKAAGVIGRGCYPDTESCALVVNFKTKAPALSFIKRLNAYLVKKAAKIKEGRKF